MSLSFAIFTFLNVWWVMLFMLLPVGIKTPRTRGEGDYAAAPRPHRWKRLFLINSAASLVVTLLIALLVNSGAIPLKDMMSQP
jgi:predicted secreted protein